MVYDFSTYRESILRRSKIQIDLIDVTILFTVFMISEIKKKYDFERLEWFRLSREIEIGKSN